MNIAELTKELDNALTLGWNEYVNSHEKLNLYRGVEINAENKDQINAILTVIQDRFAEIYPVLHFITHRQQSANNMMTNHQAFLDHLIQAGAKETEEAQA